MERYAITIQNPLYSLEVFIWDRKAKQVVISYSYPELTIDAQQKAKAKCQAYIDQNLEQEVL